MVTVGTSKYTYQLIENWAKLPADKTFGNTSAVTTDSRDLSYHRPPWDSYSRRYRLPHRPIRLSGPEVHPGRQAPAGSEQTGMCIRTPVASGRATSCLAPPVRSTPRRAGAFSFRRPLRLRRIPQRPGAPLLRRWPAHFVFGRAGQGGTKPMPPSPQPAGGRGRHGVPLRPGE